MPYHSCQVDIIWVIEVDGSNQKWEFFILEGGNLKNIYNDKSKKHEHACTNQKYIQSLNLIISNKNMISTNSAWKC